MKLPKGYLAAGVRAGLKKKGLDLALIYSERPAVVAAVFTTNQVKAAPVLASQGVLKKEKLFQAVLINSGVANACTGEDGLRASWESIKLVKKTLNIKSGVLIASTGLIGAYLSLEKLEKGIKLAAKNLGNDVDRAAEAIMTTDTFPKKSHLSLKLGGKEITLVGIAKGAGMINPELATTLFFVLTDAAVEPVFLQTSFKEVVDKTFNSITVDGDTSTNDTGYLLANGAAENSLITSKGIGSKKFKEGLYQVLSDLAFQVVKDGEGATKIVKIKVEGARTEEEARILAKSVANSLLVKTAFFGEDLNWGRILAALGKAQVPFDSWKVSVSVQGYLVYKKGQGLPISKEAEAALKNKEIEVEIRLGEGKAKSEVLTTDLSYDYVKINSSYRS